MLNGLFHRRFSSLAGYINNHLRATTIGSSFTRIDSHLHSATSHLRRDTKNEGKKFWPWSAKKSNDEEKFKITKSRKIGCDEIIDKRQILDPHCKIAIILGGATDMGLSAADSLLYHGARAVILADEDPRAGENAARSLCDFYGKNRALFIPCDLRSFSQLEGIFEESICKYKRVDVLFSNLDRNNALDEAQNNEPKLSNTARAINTGLKYMGQRNDKHGAGIIVNGASIIGFMGWPGDPTPVYCFNNKEPVAETTIDLAKMHPVEKTGVRIIAILKSQRPFGQIGLPDFPTSNSKMHADYLSQAYCEPSTESRIGKALIHVMSRASTGTTWLSEPAPCTREIPWQIYFPSRQGDIIDSQIYDKQERNYTVALEPVVSPSIAECPVNCEKQIKCKKILKRRE